jgi:hypothetical protein
MSDGKRYVLDANVFIQAYRMHYAFDICPGFWSALTRQHGFGSVCSIDRVQAELVEEGDRLTAWVKETAPESFFKRTADQQVIATFTDLIRWVQAEDQFTADAKAAFANDADAWLIAFAKVNGLIVVTHEEHAPQARKSVKIPNVCIEFGVGYCNTFTMIRDVKEQFVLKTRRRRRR